MIGGIIWPYCRKIAKTVDLFGQIKNTEQAEELMTVLYASRELKKAHPNEEVAEQQLFDFDLSWKKAWQKEPKYSAPEVGDQPAGE